MPRPLRRMLAATTVVALALAGCSSSDDLVGDSPARPSEPAGTGDGPQAGDGPRAEPDERAEPWPNRPVVDLRFDASQGLERIPGTERVRFTAQRRTCKLVFRLWANKPSLVDAGTELTVDAVRVGSRPVSPTFRSAGAPASTQGSLLRIPIQCLARGETVRVEIDFELTLGERVAERVGYSDDLAWLATAFPLLAWQRGQGWATNPVVPQFGEMVSSEEFRLRSLEVVVPESYEVLGTGQSKGRTAGPESDTEVARFTAESVRDVTVTVGELDVAAEEVDGVHIRVGAPESGVSMDLDTWVDKQAAAIADLEGILGQFPYQNLWVSVLPDGPSGIEFPSAIHYTDVVEGSPYTDHLIAHETAHMWFYGLVGNNQGTDPWLDESWATYAEIRATGPQPTTAEIPPVAEDRVGESMVWYSQPDTLDAYGPGVYAQGGQMLLEAMEAVGTERFDQLVRDYINANAHAIATPDDVVEAFESEPKVLDIFRSYGAID